MFPNLIIFEIMSDEYGIQLFWQFQVKMKIRIKNSVFLIDKKII